MSGGGADITLEVVSAVLDSVPPSVWTGETQERRQDSTNNAKVATRQSHGAVRRKPDESGRQEPLIKDKMAGTRHERQQRIGGRAEHSASRGRLSRKGRCSGRRKEDGNR